LIHHTRECSVSVFPSSGFVTPLGCTRKLNKKGLKDSQMSLNRPPSPIFQIVYLRSVRSNISITHAAEMSYILHSLVQKGTATMKRCYSVNRINIHNTRYNNINRNHVEQVTCHINSDSIIDLTSIKISVFMSGIPSFFAIFLTTSNHDSTLFFISS
jgi:hypothetical protein